MKIEKTKLDSKGRVVVPKSFRDNLGLREDDLVFLSLDETNRSIILSQYAEKNIYQILIEMNDKPGTLAKLAIALHKEGVDLITTESHSVLRTKSAIWRVMCALKGKTSELKKILKKNGALSVHFTKM